MKKSSEGLAGLDYSVLQQCMHCGMCLPTCPTYDQTGLERNSPRGRIALMRSIADGELEMTRGFADEMYYCLGCLACMSACPAGVDYATMFETARAEIEQSHAAGGGQRIFWRWLAVKTLFMHPRLLRQVGYLLRFYQWSGLEAGLRRIGLMRLLPRSLRELEPQMPRVAAGFSNRRIQPIETPSNGIRPRFRVGLLTGCVQDLVLPEINRDTVDVLLANGCEVVTPSCQPCCGSLHAHNGELELARILARRLIDLFPPEQLDAIITNAGGCGSHLKHYGPLLADDPAYADRAQEWDRKCKDIHEFLIEIGPAPLAAAADGVGGPDRRVTYHHSCHLCHGQKVREQPVDLLRMVPGLEVVPLTESDWCCGSAGIYNITQPEQANRLLERKTGHIRATDATIVGTANPGCHLQLQNGLRAAGLKTEVKHPISLLAQAYRERADGSAERS